MGGVKKAGGLGPAMKQCALEYREDKEKGKYRYKVVVPPKEVDPDNPEIWKGRDLRAEWTEMYKRLSGR